MLAFESLESIINKIKNKELSSKEVFDYFQKRIEKYDNKIEAFNYVNKNFVEKNGTVLEGIPVGVKDLYCENGVLTTASSIMLQNFIPPYDATIIKKLNDAGMNSVGKLNLDEFAMGTSGENSAIRVTKNPWALDRIPGGSSSGSAASVAAGLCPVALGTDTGGSLRQPAFMCGVVGFRPGYGRNSRYGIFPMASSFDCPGTITRTVKDASIMYELMNGYDDFDNTTVEGKHIINKEIWNREDLKGIKIGIPKEYFEEGLDKNVRETINKAIKDLEDMGAEIVNISLPTTKYAIAAYYIIVPAEVSTNLARLDGIRYGHISNLPHDNLEEFYVNNRGEGLGIESKRRSILGSYVLSAGFYDAYFTKASQVRTLIIRDFEEAFSKVDVIACPASPSVAWKIGEKIDDPLKMYIADSYTIPASLAGLPGICVPCGFAESEDEEKKSLPVGLQLIGPSLGEEKIFEIANVFEKQTKWYEKMIPAGFED
ncbi:MAG: Asp-tRNA(Asn)/Glu-tRNA(Gln) amidotransferase subunit GatA [Candidatus Gracilibacteria bacterium]|nr:Asp-tRNA(Asn)/Glu-tRNA(Gln) amidotransferase subunit GatA [Candidatus Gracilibacteria bacterium]